MPRKKKRLRLERLEARNLLAVEAVTLPGVHFANPVVYEPEIPSSQVTSAIYHDLNGDGNRDVIFGHDTGVSVALSLGEGRFDGHPTVFDLEEPTWHLAARDINQDGVVDLVAGGSSKVFVLLGQANKDAWTGFEVANTINAETNSIELGDVDQDGNVDLVLAHSSAVVYSGTGTGEFNNPIQYGSTAETAELADVDSDGDLDLITAGQQTVTVFRNDGGIFETEVDSISVTSDRPYLALGDVDDDGSLDLWVSHGSAEHSLVDLYRGNGDGTFNTNRLSIETLGLAKDIQFADINGDSRTDLVIGHRDTFHHPINGNGLGGVSIALANQTGSFHSPIRISANTPHAVIVEDMNDDGTSDVASVAYNKFQTFHQRATDLFAPEVQSFQVSSFEPIQSAVGDINGDSMMDIAIVTFDSATDETEIRVSFGANNGTFTEKSLTVVGRVSHIEIANFDADDNHELTVVVRPIGAVTEKGISVFELDESGEFRDPKTTPTASSFVTQETFDANADGIQDFLGTHGQTTAVMLGTANGHFELMNLTAEKSAFRPPILADFNQDQVTDILFVAANAFIVFLGNNDGTYTESFRQSVPSRTPIHVGEFDGDGNLDIATVARAEEGGFVYHGRGDGSFTDRQAFPNVVNSVLYVTDMNNDGMSDLLYETGEKIQLLINRGS